MKTTAIFVELFIVGLITLLLLVLAIFVISPELFNNLISLVKNANLPFSAWALAVAVVAYVTGIIADELYDRATRRLLEENIVIKHKLKMGKSKAYKLQARAMQKGSETAIAIGYMRGRIRILRSTVVVFPFATLFCTLAVGLRGPIIQSLERCMEVFFTLFFCLLITGCAIFVYFSLEYDYWLRIRTFGEEEQKKRPS